MNKTLLSKTLAVSIILLLIGVSVSSAISVDTKPSISNNESIEDCGCNEVSDADLNKVERLLDRVEVYNKLLLVLSRHNAELLEDYEVLSNRITTLTEMNEELKPNKPFEDNPFLLCIILASLLIILDWISADFYFKALEYKDNPILFRIYWSLYILFGLLWGGALILFFKYCDSSIINKFHLKPL